MTDRSTEAWNNFVFSQRDGFETGSAMRSAAIAKDYMGQVNRGGINSFLTYTSDLDASEVLEALVAVGALTTANQFEYVLRALGAPLPSSSEEARWELLEQCWPEELDEHDFLSAEADAELMRVLEIHVREHEDFYVALSE